MIEVWDKLLPNQYKNNELYSGSVYHLDLWAALEPLCRPPQIINVEFPATPGEAMASNPVLLRFLNFLVRILQPLNVFEIGTYVGLAAIHMAEALPLSGQITTIEKLPLFADYAARNFKANHVEGKVCLHVGDAMKIIDIWPIRPTFGLAFIDGDKEHYPEYLAKITPLMLPRGVIVIDDVFFHGDAIGGFPKTAKGKGALKVMEMAMEWRLRSILPFGNGVLLLQKDEAK